MAVDTSARCLNCGHFRAWHELQHDACRGCGCERFAEDDGVSLPLTQSGAAMLIAAECAAIERMLQEKNRKYGNSALDPVRVFSKASPIEQILVRLDDKLSRLRALQPDEQEDVIADLLGYLVLLRIAQRQAKEGGNHGG